MRSMVQGLSARCLLFSQPSLKVSSHHLPKCESLFSGPVEDPAVPAAKTELPRTLAPRTATSLLPVSMP